MLLLAVTISPSITNQLAVWQQIQIYPDKETNVSAAISERQQHPLMNISQKSLPAPVDEQGEIWKQTKQ